MAVDNIARALAAKAIAGEGGSGSVTGITVDGTDLPVEDGKVALPIGSANNAGLFKTSLAHGITSYKDELRINPAGVSNIDSRGTSKPIAPSNLNYAVTAALTDAKHIVLTSEQQATAKEVLGIGTSEPTGTFELIETIDLLSLGTDVTQITRTQETDGTAYNFSSVIIKIYLGFATVSGTVVFSADKNMNISFEQLAPQGTQASAETDIVAENRNGAYMKYSYSETWTEVSLGEFKSEGKRIDTSITISTSNINKIVINWSVNGGYYDGDTIKIYGVRA